MPEILKSIFKKKQHVEKGSYEYFVDRLSYLFNVLVSAYYSSMLKWYEILIVVISGGLLGVGVGIAIYVMFVRPAPVIIIPLNETHIIKVR
jgi:NhaP-type Na+/H+ or K+/H+ antiporter